MADDMHPLVRRAVTGAAALRASEVAGAVVLAASVIALVWANSPLGDSYQAVREFQLGPLDVQHWAADGALALFFFIVGLELKREFVLGSLRDPRTAMVPIIAAFCGVAVPALIFVVANLGTDNLRGWAVPAATDIAFAVAVLAVVGSALPGAARTFLLTLAVVDDLIVIVIIAVFYSSSISFGPLALSLALIAVYALLQRLRVSAWVVYVPIALAAWWFLHESGIHATIAGVALGMVTRVLTDDGEEQSPAMRLEHVLTPWSAGFAVPFFALMSAGVAVQADVEFLTDPIVLGVTLGLFLGKPLGIVTSTLVMRRVTGQDDGLSPSDVIGLGLVAGIGFTVSLLVAELSFAGPEVEEAKAAVLLGSLLSALAGAAVLIRRNRAYRGVRMGTVPENETPS